MDIGNAIKTLRKQKGISQKQLAEICEISVNALCQIENDQTFPHKSTIQKICDALQVPTSYLLFFSISEEDVPENKRGLFKDLSPTMKSLLLGSI